MVQMHLSSTQICVSVNIIFWKQGKIMIMMMNCILLIEKEAISVKHLAGLDWESLEVAVQNQHINQYNKLTFQS